jgi:hypothetical protein
VNQEASTNDVAEKMKGCTDEFAKHWVWMNSNGERENAANVMTNGFSSLRDMGDTSCGSVVRRSRVTIYSSHSSVVFLAYGYKLSANRFYEISRRLVMGR